MNEGAVKLAGAAESGTPADHALPVAIRYPLPHPKYGTLDDFVEFLGERVRCGALPPMEWVEERLTYFANYYAREHADRQEYVRLKAKFEGVGQK